MWNNCLTCVTFPFWGNEHISLVDGGGGAWHCECTKYTALFTLKRVNFILCEFHLNIKRQGGWVLVFPVAGTSIQRSPIQSGCERGGNLGERYRRMGKWRWQDAHSLLPRFQVVASVVDQDSFSGFAPLQPQVS